MISLVQKIGQATDDLTKAEDFEKSAITKMGGVTRDFVMHQYVPVLKGMLYFQVQVLTALEHSHS